MGEKGKGNNVANTEHCIKIQYTMKFSLYDPAMTASGFVDDMSHGIQRRHPICGAASGLSASLLMGDFIAHMKPFNKHGSLDL